MSHSKSSRARDPQASERLRRAIEASERLSEVPFLKSRRLVVLGLFSTAVFLAFPALNPIAFTCFFSTTTT